MKFDCGCEIRFAKGGVIIMENLCDKHSKQILKEEAESIDEGGSRIIESLTREYDRLFVPSDEEEHQEYTGLDN